MGYSLRCPSCRGKFPWNPTEGMPDICPLCEGKVGHDRADDDIVLPFIRSSGRSKTIDNVYRDMERGSEVRAAAAAEMTGAPVSEMASLKITNMRDNQRAGDMAVQVPNNPVSQFMQANPGISGFQPAAALAYGGQISSGPHANAGARMRTVLQNMHSASGNATSEIPTVETHYNPNYRFKG